MKPMMTRRRSTTAITLALMGLRSCGAVSVDRDERDRDLASGAPAHGSSAVIAPSVAGRAGSTAESAPGGHTGGFGGAAGEAAAGA